MPRSARIAPALAVFAVAFAVALAVPAQARGAWVWPLRGEVIEHYRNGTDPYAAGQHRGIDIAGGVGAPVVAATGGDVRFAGTAGSSGLTVSVRTDDGRFDTSYLHLSAAAVREGQRVKTGERIGTVGASGARSSERPHLHFGVRDAGSRHAYHDPLTFLPPVPGPREAPRGTPAPTPVASPVPLEPTPVSEPPRVPTLRRIPVGRRVPIRPRVPARPGLPAPRHAPVPRPAPPPRPAPVARGAPVARHAPPPRRVPEGIRAPLPGHAPEGLRTPDRSPLPGTRHLPAPGATEAPARGPDIGWALACVGLLLAAAVLGSTEDGRRAARRGRAQVGGLLRPLWGRR